MFRTLLATEGQLGLPIPNLGRKPKHVSQNCINNSDKSDSDFASHETDGFTEEGDCEDGADCIAQPLGPNNFVLLKLKTKKTV